MQHHDDSSQTQPPGQRLRIACIGEAMVEVAVAGDGTARVGFAGDVLNTAIYLRRELPRTADVAFVSMVGGDDLSNQMLDFIGSERVDTTLTARHPTRQPGLYVIRTDPAGERSFTYWRDQSAARVMFGDTAPDFAAIGGFDLIYLSAITLAILSPEVRAALLGWIAGFRQRGGRLAFDSNYRPRLWPDLATAQRAVAAAWHLADIALPSVDDEMALFGDSDEGAVLARLRSWGVRDGALKRGVAGPLPVGGAIGGASGGRYLPAARVVDSTAAGDSFNGGFLAAHLLGNDSVAAMQAGHDCASIVVGHRGALVPKQLWPRQPAGERALPDSNTTSASAIRSAPSRNGAPGA